MIYEIMILFPIMAGICLLLLIQRWVRRSLSLRTLIMSGGFSYFALLALPRIFVWQNHDTLMQVLFVAVTAILFSWILAYHKI